MMGTIAKGIFYLGIKFNGLNRRIDRIWDWCYYYPEDLACDEGDNW